MKRVLQIYQGSAGSGRARWGRRGFAVALVLCFLTIALQAWWVLTPGPTLRLESQVIEIPAHRGSVEVAQLLGRAGVIQSPLGFLTASLVRGSARSLKAGEYQFPQNANTLTILRKNVDGAWVLARDANLLAPESGGSPAPQPS